MQTDSLHAPAGADATGCRTLDPSAGGNALFCGPSHFRVPFSSKLDRINVPSRFAARTREEIQHDLWGFPDHCIDAAIRFQATGARDALVDMLPGLIEFHLPSGAAKLPAELREEHRLSQDLGLDSLSLTEMAFKMDELLGVPIEIREIAGIRTVGDLKAFIWRKLEQG